ncbi:uncharacterized protein [Mobula birostris]|uniref:uncharacterized protein n=1 Tax=Mobula birostris TaxID=1983395 RepID=UPI003B28DA7D
MLEEDLALPPVHLLSLITLRSQNFASTRSAKSISPSKQLTSVPGPSGGQDSVIETSPHQQTGLTRVSRASTFHEGSLTVLVEMERKLRAAVAERERLLQARELEKKRLENTESERAKREEGKMVAERDTSTHQLSQHWALASASASHFDLRSHVESAGHCVASCPHLVLSSSTCRGSLTKVGQRFQTWRTRWFVFDTRQGRLSYYTDQAERKRKGVIYFQAFEEVYFDHLRNAPKSPNPLLTFCLKTYDRLYYLVAPSDEALRIWMEVVLTAVEGARRF